MEETMKRFRRFIGGLGVGLIAAVIYQELRRPPEERTWHGRIGGFMPYDLRPPTPERLRDAYWNPDEPRIFTDRVLGIGWAINFYSLLQVLSELIAELQTAIREHA
jgi:hypothetical protein